MRKARLAEISRRRYCVTTRHDGSPASPDLVDRAFKADAPNKLWVADITYIPTWVAFLFLAVVIDAWSQKVVGWSITTDPKTDVVIAAFNTAVERRQPEDVMHHSDRGCQYTPIAFRQRYRMSGVRPPMGSVGDASVNAMCEFRIP